MDDFTQEHDFDLFDGGILFEHRAASGGRGSRIKVVTEGGHAFSLYQEEARALCQWLTAHVPSVDPAPVASMTDAELRAAWLRTDGEVGDPVADALAAEMLKRGVDV